MVMFSDLCLKHGFACHLKEFYIIVNAKPKNMELLVKGRPILSHHSVTFSLPSPSLGEELSKYHKCNKYIRSVIIDFIEQHYNIFKDFDPEEDKELRMNYLTFPGLLKVK